LKNDRRRGTEDRSSVIGLRSLDLNTDETREIMINWLDLLTNSIWILALALALAIFSIAYYQSQQWEEKIRSVLNSPKYALPLNLSGALFCLGMAVTADRWWEIMLWIVLMVLFGYQAYKISKLSKKS